MAPAPRRIPLLLCILGVVCCAVALAGLGPVDAAQSGDTTAQPQPTEGLALPERVVLDGQASHGATTVERDVSAGIDRRGAGADGAYERALLREQLARADDQEERYQVLVAWAERLERSLQRLDERERTARRDYDGGERTARDLLLTLRTVNDRAEQLELVADELHEEASAEGATNVTSAVDALRGDLVARQGPVRTQVTEVAAGEEEAARFHVSATANGTVLATIQDDQYHREAVRSDLLQARGTVGMNLTAVWPLTTERLYPVHQDHYGFTSVGRRIVLFQLYRVQAEDPAYPHGELQAYVDGVSETVFWEYQRLDLDEDLPTAGTDQRIVNDTTVAVQRTYPGGPARVTVTDEGEPVENATVALDGTNVAETDENGVGWVVLPERADTLRVTSDGVDVESDVSW